MDAPRYTVHGLAIVSADDRITDESGKTPESLRNAADWDYFQYHLSAADVTVLGRLAHEHNPNDKGRQRLVLSRSLAGLEQREHAWWWNPAGVPWSEVCAAVLPDGGSFAVPGGQAVFDLFLPHYDVFHLSRAEHVVLGAGRLLFSDLSATHSADTVLQAHGLQPGEAADLDAPAGVTLTLYERAPVF